jgi:uncharacterized protein involved in outer membrane biogenesis
MKSMLKAVALILFAVVLAVSAYLTFKFDDLLRAAILEYGPQVTQTKLEVSSIHVHPILGSATINGLVVGNPKGFSKENAFAADKIKASLRTKSLLTDTIVVDLVEVDGAKVNLEGKGANSNLTKIESNANAFAAGMQKKLGGGDAKSAKASKAEKSKNILIKRMVLKGAQATVRYGLISGDALSVSLPDIELREISTANKTSVIAELVSRVTRAVQDAVVKTAAQPLKDLGKTAKDVGKGVTKELGSQLNGLFGKKKKK